MLACPITSRIKNYPFEVRIKAKKIDGVVLADQVKNLDWSARNVSLAGKASPTTMQQTQELIETLLKG